MLSSKGIMHHNILKYVCTYIYIYIYIYTQYTHTCVRMYILPICIRTSNVNSTNDTNSTNANDITLLIHTLGAAPYCSMLLTINVPR